MPYNSVTEHPGPIKLSVVGTLIFALVSKSVDRISKFALIKKLGKKLNFSAWGGSAILDFAILASSMVTIHSVVAMETGPVAKKKFKKI